MAVSRVTFTDVIAKLLVTAIVVLIGGMPTWLFLLARYVLSPEGFWQNLILGVVGLWLLGGLQIFLAIVAVMAILTVWLN